MATKLLSPQMLNARSYLPVQQVGGTLCRQATKNRLLDIMLGEGMSENAVDIIALSSEVRDLLESELNITVGNMEVISFTETLYKLIRARAYNEGILDARRVLEHKMEDITEQLEVLLQYD